MTTHRNRAEAVWTDETARVKGKRNRNRFWVLFGLVALGAVIISLTWSRMMGVTDVTYELRHCQQPIAEDASWQEVQAAACDPAPIEGLTARQVAASDEQEPSSSSGSTWTFKDVPVNSPENSFRLRLTEPATTVVLAEPGNEKIRREFTGDAEGIRWNAFVGSRGPSEYWILVTPGTPAEQ